MRFHLEMEERTLVEAGHEPSEARRLARLRFGGVERYKERARAQRPGHWLDGVARDAGYAVRGMRRRPGFALTVLITLGIGIGASTAVFSVVDAVLLRPLPYRASDRLVEIRTSWTGEPDAAASPAEYLDYRRGTGEVLIAVAAYTTGTVTVAGDGEAERVQAVAASAGLFPVLASTPVAGRGYTAEEDEADAPVAVLSEGYWRRRVGGDPGIIGGTIRLNGEPYTVTGVMPSEFQVPEAMLTDGTDPGLYIPLGLDPDTTYERGSHYLQVVGRLAPGVTVERAARQVEAVVERFSSEYPGDYEREMGFRATAVPLQEAVVGDVRPTLLVAIGSVLLVLLVVAANVAALLVARGEARRGEMALRSTLGARRGRLVRQLLVESLVLGLAGGVLGALTAWIGVEALVQWSPPGIPRLRAIDVNGRVLAFTATLSVATGLLFGLLPALQVAPEHTSAALRRLRSGGGGRRLRRLLVAGEIALALTLVVGAGLLARTMSNLLAVDTGLRIDGVVATEFTIPAARYPEDAAVRDLAAHLVDRVSALPGVEAAGAANPLPLAEPIGDLGVRIPGRTLPGDGNLDVDWQVVTPGYDQAVGLTLVQGRWIEPTDRTDATGAVVINRTFAERFWPGGDAVGATLALTARTTPAEARIVGIVEDVAHEGPATATRPQMFIPHRQFRFWYDGPVARSLALVVRPAPDRAVPAAAIRGVFAELDPELGIGPFLALKDAYRAVLARPRLLTGLLSAFAATALVLAVIGVYGVTAYSVRRRQREFGIRVAMGARARSISGTVVREALRVSIGGVVVGVLGALLLSRSLAALLYDVSPTDPGVIAVSAALLTLAAVVAAWLPARRAARADPAHVLQAE